MANILPTSSLVLKETLGVLKNKRGFMNTVSRDFNQYFGNPGGYDSSTTVTIKKPPRFQFRSGRQATLQDVQFPTTTLTVAQGGTEYGFSASERTVSVSRFERIVEAAAETVLNQIDTNGLDLVRRTAGQFTGTVGTYPNSQATALSAITTANAVLDEQAASMDPMNRFLAASPRMNAALIQGEAGLFNSSDALSQQYKKGRLVDSLGLTIFTDQNVARHTNGTQAAAVTVNGAGQIGGSLTVPALAGTLTAGQRFTIPGVFTVNPQNRTTQATLFVYVVASDVAAGATSIPLVTPIVTTGAFQNASASPANGATLAFLGGAGASYECSAIYDERAFGLAMVPMAMPIGGIEASQDTQDGITIKVSRATDFMSDISMWRLDVMFGWVALYPELSCLIVA
jgi:hypothetical protein